MSPAAARGLRLTARVIFALGVFLAVLTARVVSSSHQELRAGDARRGDGDPDAAIAHYRRAARWYAPLNPYPPRALAALEAIGREAEAAGENARALSAYRSIRAAILSTRSTYVPSRQELAAADRRIAALMAEDDPPPIDAGLSREERERAYLGMLKEPLGPSLGLALLAVLGFGLWVVAALAFSYRAIDADDRLVRPAALRWSVTFVAGFVLFCIGLAFA